MRTPPAAAIARSVAVAALALLSGGCLRAPRTVTELPAANWPARLGTPGQAPFERERVPDRVRVEWEAGFGRGLPAVPLVHGTLVTLVVSGGGIQTASAVDGSRYWSRRFRGAVAGQALQVQDRVYFATQFRESTVYALDLRRGRRIWSQRLRGRAAADAVHADGTLYVATDRGEIVALAAASGAIRWSAPIQAEAAAPPLVMGDELLVASTRDSLIRVSRANGRVTARLPLGGTASAPLAARGDTIFIALFPGTIAAFAARGDLPLWRHDLDAPLLAAPAATDDGVYLLSRNADIFRADQTGATRLARLGGVATESLTVTADGLLAGRLDGTLTFLRRSGETVWQERVDGSIRAPAAVRDGSIYVATLSGRLYKLSAPESSP